MTITRLSSECPMCSKPLRRRSRRDGSGEFLSCSGYPKCDFAETLDLNLQRIARELNAAKSDAEYLEGWADIVRAKIRAMRASTDRECPVCTRHLAELEALL